MKNIIAVRREDKNQWERRAPLTPADAAELKKDHGIDTIVQPSPIRVFTAAEYEQTGCRVIEDMSPANLVLAIKEIPIPLLEQGKTYAFFSHTIKGQPYNMNMLRRLVELKCNLFDYERIVDEKKRRLLFFGKYAGLAGMVETLHSFGQKLEKKGYDTPLGRVQQAYHYGSVEKAVQEITELGREITKHGLPKDICPLVVGFAGYGNTSIGAQEMFDHLPFKEIAPADLASLHESKIVDNRHIYKVVFYEKDMMEPLQGDFDLPDYFNHPERYRSCFDRYIPYLNVLMLCIYWSEKYPRLITKKYLIEQNKTGKTLKLDVVGDISCDIGGAVEITYKITKPDNSTFTYLPGEDRFEDGILPQGVAVVAIDNLPCEFPRESSSYFSSVLKGFVPALATTDFSKPFEALDLPAPLRRALILHHGQFTPDYTYMEKFIQ